MWIDAHTHLEMLEGDTQNILDEAAKSGVTHCITIGCHPQDFSKVCQISEKHYPRVAATLGVHPHEAKFWSDDIEKQIRESTLKQYIVGIGEIGLDYHYNHSDQATQVQVFRKQMEIAKQLKYPVQIHSRNADDDTCHTVQEFRSDVRGMLHCFTGTRKLAEVALDCGYFISFSGVVTFKNADDLRETLKYIPLDRILIETDAPFLAPVPMRGKPNSPGLVVHTAQKVAEVKQVSLQKLSEQVKKNIKTLFPKWAL